jgi:hypothetical protein
MKIVINTILTLLVATSSYAANVPIEFIFCEEKGFSYGDLGYYTDEELALGYCRCAYLVNHYDVEVVAKYKKSKLYEELGDQDGYNRSIAEAKAFKKTLDIAAENQNKMGRILKKDYAHKQAPDCMLESGEVKKVYK